MADRFDIEWHAVEADNHAESACRISLAQGWRDLVRGYRMLSDFISDETVTVAQYDQDRPDRSIEAVNEVQVAARKKKARRGQFLLWSRR